MPGINIHEAKTHFSKLLERVAEGEDVIISRAGVPVAVVIRIDRYKLKRQFGVARGVFKMGNLESFNAPLDPETLACFTGDAE